MSMYQGWTPNEYVKPANKAQLVALRDLLLGYNDQHAAAAVDNVIDILSQSAQQDPAEIYGPNWERDADDLHLVLENGNKMIETVKVLSGLRAKLKVNSQPWMQEAVKKVLEWYAEDVADNVHRDGVISDLREAYESEKLTVELLETLQNSSLPVPSPSRGVNHDPTQHSYSHHRISRRAVGRRAELGCEESIASTW